MIQDNKEQVELIDLIKTLCRIPAPSGKERARAEFVCNWLAGCCPNSDVFIDDADNAVLRMGAKGPYTIFMAHTDTVFPDLEPFEVIEQGNRLYCPGIGDDTANLAMLMCAAKSLYNSGAETLPALFVADSGEEGLGNLRGCRRLMEDYAGNIKQVVSFDGKMGELNNRAVGSIRYRVTVSAEGGHSYSSFGASNAIELTARLVKDLYEITPPENPYGKATFNVGVITGGTSVNTIAENCEMLFEIRACDRNDLEMLEKEFYAAVNRIKPLVKKIEIDIVGERPCGINLSKQQSELEEIAIKQIIRVTGKHPDVKPGSTDASLPISLGIPAITLGAYCGGEMHNRNEWIDTDSLTDGLELVSSLVLDLIGVKGK